MTGMSFLARTSQFLGRAANVLARTTSSPQRALFSEAGMFTCVAPDEGNRQNRRQGTVSKVYRAVNVVRRILRMGK